MTDRTGADVVHDALRDAGVELLVGLPGTQTLALDRVVADRDELTYVMARHETAIPHVAWGYYEATGRPAATLTVPGPGDTNAMHGLQNAHEDCVPILHVSADVAPEHRGKGPIHELDPGTFDAVVKENVTVERAVDLPSAVAAGIETALTEPYGPVRLGVPASLLAADVGDAPDATVDPETRTYDNAAADAAARTLLEDAERPLVYAGGGARRSAGGAEAVRALADALDAPVLTSYKGKGVFPEDDPRCLGVTGSHTPAGAVAALDAADVVLALGTDFDGVATDGWSLPMGDSLVHVTLALSDVDAAYDADVAVVDDVAAAADRLLDGLDSGGTWDGERVGRDVRAEYERHLADADLLDPERAPATTPALLRAVRDVTPRDVPVTTDVGGFRLWSMQLFDAHTPKTFVTAGSWAGMGVGLPAAIGAAAGRDGPVLCLTGDGGLMMCVHELHTLAEADLNVTVVVSNNADYGVISKSPAIRDAEEGAFAWDAADFATVAEGMGVRATSVDTASDAADAVAAALARDGPDLVDVTVDPDEPSAAAASEYESDLDRA
ncbi:thiamine pyrophosphate-binding protein (plasmid) [Halarchaeum sp. CBA1220]|uniref:thiamine pyrophosphate-binding protein n=1 Tax=Halarchaeum sp. CBA1220 TaxID=1853682 RepID=UPI000F3A872D|nr:thiamine pyrophosphate-binding protein [Halarchaeum sp. CBA1220]QLC34765.1 thiamine pyrophosphate-binding protein [Halarchaeum sp. CBA1220]